MTRRLMIVFLIASAFVSSASAHYLWVIVDEKAEQRSAALIYFEEGPGPGDGHYLDPILATNKTWLRTVKTPAGIVIAAEELKNEKQRWLSAPLSEGEPRSIDVYAKFGVYRYGKTDVLLHYYARTLDVKTHEDLHELGRSEKMDLDIEPHDFGSRMTLTVRWHGKPVEGRIVHIRGPKGLSENLTTDADGKVTFKMENDGRYTARTHVEEDKPGQDGGMDYSLVRHHATLVMNLPLEK